MSSQAQAQSDQPFVYERTFLRTVLCLRGVEDAATDREIEEARGALRQYELSMAKARSANSVNSNGWLRGRLPETTAVEHAFMFVKFHMHRS